ncbi:HAD-IIA family hydrolase [Mycobacterium sp.]|uniref:HAD-IIA family hydrolase n=1 Tax=Mycobacterium sp. TaxID=1785 RepID=UPI0031D5EF6B
MAKLTREHDCLLLDLDGTLYRGQQVTECAVQSLDDSPSRKLFITNNASRTPEDVAAHLRDLGFTADGDDVATAAQSAARLLAELLPSGSRVLVVGAPALADEVVAAGLRPVSQFHDDPVAVVQGLSFDTNWSDLAEATLAIRDGAVWVAANLDRTIPTERGLVPCNGSMVAALQAATEAEPQVAGKPAPTMIIDAANRADCRAPLVVGDRVDTDIAGANAAGLPSMLVLSGANTVLNMLQAETGLRPTYVGHDLRSLHEDRDLLAIGPQSAWDVEIFDSGATVFATGKHQFDDGLSVVRAVASAVWDANFDGQSFTIGAGDNDASEALNRWSLISEDSEVGRVELVG